MKERKSILTIMLALFVTLSVLTLGYMMLGVIPMLLFAFGFVGGFVCWLAVPRNFSFKQIAFPFFLALALFIVHKYEERVMDFFPRLSQLTGVPVPETNSILVYLLYAFALLWLLIPVLVYRKIEFGYYLTWTFFVSMGVTEIAHFIFPFFTDKSYTYFPGMTSAIFFNSRCLVGNLQHC